MKRSRGAQKGNQNAAKPTRKRYVSVFGQRWPVDVGEKIIAYLKRQGKTQKQFLDDIVEEKITTENADA